MKGYPLFYVILLLAMSGCDSGPSSSHGHAHNTVSASDCKETVDRAIARAGSDPAAIGRVAESALEDCMAGK